jgi:PAS domain S-box-containing protein
MKDPNLTESTTEQFEITADLRPNLPRAVQAAAVMQTEQSRILVSILDAMDEGVVAADRNETFLVFNPAAQRMFGRGPIESQSEKWSSEYGLFLPDRVTPFPAEKLPLSRAIRGEQVDGIEMFVKHDKAPDGLWVVISGRPLKDAAGRTVGGIVVCRDVTAQRNEEAFRAGQAKILEMIAANAPLGDILANLVLLIEGQSPDMICSILLLSADGNHVEHGAAPHLPEYYVKAIDGQPIGPKNGSCGTAMYRGKPVVVTDIFKDPLWEDYRDLAKDTGLRACWSTPILSARGKVLGSFAMYYHEPKTPTGSEARLTDVATHIAGLAIEHQRIVQALQRTQAELARDTQATNMRELARSIGREVNQTLAAIVENADVCLQKMNGRPDDLTETRQRLSDIATNARQTIEVIARVRALAQSTVPEKTQIDLKQIANDVLGLVREEALRNNITLQLESPDNLVSVMGDRVQLQQALLNLVMNGMDAMSGIKDRELGLTIAIARNESEVVTAVTDRGTGIKAQELEQVFDAFHTTKGANLGMGLAISRSIIEAHGGRLWAERNIGPGTTFKFSLPV